MKKPKHRIIIYTKDVEMITGRKRKTAEALLRNIRAYFNKQERDMVTVYEFCVFTKINEEEVRAYLMD